MLHPKLRLLFVPLATLAVAPLSSLSAAETLVQNTSQLASAVATAQPGDVIIWTDGTYDDVNIKFYRDWNGTQAPAAGILAGTEGAPITLKAETPGGVIFTGESRLKLGGEYLVVDGFRFEGAEASAVIEFRDGGGLPGRLAHHSRVTNCAVVDLEYDDLTDPSSSRWVMMYGSNNRLDHCYFSGKTSLAPLMEVVHSFLDYNLFEAETLRVNNRIDHNVFANRGVFVHPVTSEVSTNELETIRLGTSEIPLVDPDLVPPSGDTDDSEVWEVEVAGHNFPGFNIVENNYFFDCSGEAEIISSKSCDNIFRYNTFVECEGSLTLRHAHRCTVEGNVFLGNGKGNTGGIRTTGSDHVVINNYMEDLRGTGSRAALSLMAGESSPAPSGYNPTKTSLFAFNTLVNCSQSLRLGESLSNRVSKVPESCWISNNLMISNVGAIVSVDKTPTNFQYEANYFFGTSLGFTNPGGITVEDPLLTEDAWGLARPSAASPALSSAATGYTAMFAVVATDLQGQVRGSPADLGADEVAVAIKPLAPLSSDVVGPVWMRAAAVPQIESSALASGVLTLVISFDGEPASWTVETSTEIDNWAEADSPSISGPDTNGHYTVEMTFPSGRLFVRITSQ